MAFCPNCGTPNTDQAEKCVSCGFEIAPKQKAKFKGTIMMSGVQAPTAPAPAAQPAPAPAPAPVAQPAVPGAKNLAFEKTIMGPMAAPPTPAPPPAQQPSAPPVQDFSRAPTMEGQAPFMNQPAGQGSFQPPAQPAFTPPAQQPSFQQPAQPSAPPAASFGGGGASSGSFGAASAGPAGGGSFGGGATTGSFGGGGGGGYGNTGGFGDSMAPPAGLPKKTSTGKILAIGCVGVLVLTCVVGGLLFMVMKDKFNEIMGAVEKEGDAIEWRASLSQSLAQVSALCQTDCNAAAVYFHPQVQGQLANEAKNLTTPRVQKLVDPTQSEARMLNSTEDTGLATALNLDPTQCVRLTSASSKIVACSVPDATGTASLRIIHLSGLSGL